MSSSLLDNPIWSSLATEHSQLAHGTAMAKRYAADVAPFAAIEAANAAAAADLASIVKEGESVYWVAVAPGIDERWTLLSSSRIVQMVWRAERFMAPDTTEIVRLTARDAEDMLALTTAVFPGFFRRRTPEMGGYYGIHEMNVLAAMAGERMRITGHQEISAVCTHPEFTGRGYAARLVNYVTHLIRSRGLTPFLHVGEANARARELYLRLGFVERALLPMWYVRRTNVAP
jgi:ribosomal protein S18 acetylase RimI-like enzyme